MISYTFDIGSEFSYVFAAGNFDIVAEYKHGGAAGIFCTYDVYIQRREARAMTEAASTSPHLEWLEARPGPPPLPREGGSWASKGRSRRDYEGEEACSEERVTLLRLS